MNWITRLLGGPRKKYVFRHEHGMRRVIYARNRKQADRRLRAFLSDHMFGSFGFWYNPEALERECKKCRLLNEWETRV